MSIDKKDHEKIADAWVKYTLLEYESPFIANYEWASDAVADIIADDPQQGLTLIKTLLERAENDHLIANLAAGPLETLLSRHGSSIIDEIETESLKNKKFNYLLGGVWKGGMSDEVWERFQKIERPTW